MAHHTQAQAHVQHATAPLPPANLYGTPELTFAIIAVLMIVIIYVNRWAKNTLLLAETHEVKSED